MLIFITGIIISALAASLILFTARYIRMMFAAFFIILLIWWFMYYYRLEYISKDNTLCIISGTLLRRYRYIDNKNILWLVQVQVPFIREAVMTCLHTAGGTIYILGNYSTRC